MRVHITGRVGHIDSQNLFKVIRAGDGMAVVDNLVTGHEEAVVCMIYLDGLKAVF